MISTAKVLASHAAARGALLGAVALTAGCSSTIEANDGRFLGFIRPYRMEVVQGNVVTREQVSAVRPGMTREQLRDILGSPMLADPFHGDRWDYVFTIRRQGTEPQRRSIVALFNGNVLERLVVPPDLPTESEFVASIAPVQRPAEPRVLELTPEQRKALPLPPKADPAIVQAPTGAARSYPPLEPP
jgi:outer membrane protein assembly factor BamE